MKISFNWLKQYIQTDLSAEKAAEILTNTGLEVEGIEPYESIKGGLKGLVIGEVIDLNQHENADRLKVAKIDVGAEQLQIVCGASNIAKGQKVIVATNGTTLYPTGGESFKIKKAKLRGVESNGMICAEDEIGLGNSHEGIMVLPNDYEVGQPASKYFPVDSDTIFEIGITPNRSDALSHIGVARDLLVALKTNHNFTGSLDWPEVEIYQKDNDELSIKVTVEDNIACPRYAGVTISGVDVKPSPSWLQGRLKAIGLSPINNIVDVTNFVLHELGQPLHAFDADQITGKEVIVKKLPKNTSFKTLDEKERKLSENDLMICNPKEGMCIAGVFGGMKSGVTETTKNIFLESAYFDPSHIRKTSSTHGLRTDAAVRFEKSIDPDKVVYALKRAALLIKEVAGGSISSEIVDVYPSEIEPSKVTLRYGRINMLTGLDIPKEKVKSIVEELDIKIDAEIDEALQISVPAYRSDVTREADVIEEVLRIIGFDNIPLGKEVKSTLSFSIQPDRNKLINTTAEFLASNGYHEIMGNSITHSQHYDKQLTELKDKIIPLLSYSSADLDALRPSMLFSGLEAIAYNINRSNDRLRLFEFGKTYHKRKDGFSEKEHLTIFFTGDKAEANWLKKSEGASLFELKSTVEALLQLNGISEWEENPVTNDLFEQVLELRSNKDNIGIGGKLSAPVLKQWGIKQPVFYVDLNWEFIVNHPKTEKKYRPIPKFPGMKRDLALIIDKSKSFKEIETIAKKTEGQLLRKINLFDVYEDGKLGKDKKSCAVSYFFQHEDRTLTDKEIDDVMSRLMKNYEQQLEATIRK